MPSGNLNNDDYWNYGMGIFNGAYQFRHGDYLRLHPSNWDIAIDKIDKDHGFCVKNLADN